jgi:hypothetical protein
MTFTEKDYYGKGAKVKKYHLADWNLVCSPKDQGGLGVLDLNKMNEALLAKRIWNLENSNGLWQTIIRQKYIKGRPIISVKKRQSDSHFWKGILEVHDNFYRFCKKKVGNGKSTSFWNNIWCDSVPLSFRYPNLFDIAYDKNITVEKVLSSDFQFLTFRRRLLGDLATDYNNLIVQCNKVGRFNYDDKVAWSLGKHGFSVKSFYKESKCSHVPVPSNFLWKTRLPHKIKVFLWLVLHNKILTRDNLRKRSWKGPLNYVFCGLSESIDHLLFQCSVARFMWRIIQTALDLTSVPYNVENIFGPWINSFNKNERNLVLFGCGAVI